mmetsp:Transcript_4512/g.10859  ORF Transcript_4512/g.10859 Transcript_4512/m.10859 type:complete len:224 (+) Transcript_4512:1825-2496(+)
MIAIFFQKVLSAGRDSVVNVGNASSISWKRILRRNPLHAGRISSPSSPISTTKGLGGLRSLSLPTPHCRTHVTTDGSVEKSTGGSSTSSTSPPASHLVIAAMHAATKTLSSSLVASTLEGVCKSPPFAEGDMRDSVALVRSRSSSSAVMYGIPSRIHLLKSMPFPLWKYAVETSMRMRFFEVSSGKMMKLYGRASRAPSSFSWKRHTPTCMRLKVSVTRFIFP